MTGKTHRVGGMLGCLAGYSILESKGMLLNGVSPLVQLTVMYPFAIYGSVVSDLDHNWHSAPSKDIVSYGINKVLHLTTNVSDSVKKKFPVLNLFDAKHRSWQTHSDVFLVLMILLSSMLINGSSGSIDGVVLKLVFTGLMLGIVSHLFLDLLTPEGLWSLLGKVLSKTKVTKSFEKIHLVPKTKFFATGGKWEELIRKLMWVICLILFARLLYIISPYKISLGL